MAGAFSTPEIDHCGAAPNRALPRTRSSAGSATGSASASTPTTIRAPTPTSVHWGGYGGSFLTMDPASGISCGYAQNQLLLDGGPFADRRRVEFWQLLGEITETL